MKITKNGKELEKEIETLSEKIDDCGEPFIRKQDVTRNSSAKPTVVKLDGSPSSGFVDAIKSSNLLGFQFE